VAAIGSISNFLRREGQVVASGHGALRSLRAFRLDEGQYVTVYGDIGDLITSELGNAIEYSVLTGSRGILDNVFSETYGPGRLMPNLTLFPVEGYGPSVRVSKGTLVVETPTELVDILRSIEGPVHLHWAACLACKGLDGTDRELPWRFISEETSDLMSEWRSQNRR
jgi:hypothetical protein